MADNLSSLAIVSELDGIHRIRHDRDPVAPGTG
jgi:hypothetical protein